MGIFRVFKKKKEEVIEFEEIQDWLDTYVEKQDIANKIAYIKRELKAKTTKAHDLLKELEKATLKNEKIIPERAISIFEGNRTSYINKTKLFLANLEMPEQYDGATEFLKESAEKMEKLAEDTQKNFYVIREFIGDEAGKVASKLSEFDKLISSAIERLDETALHKIAQVKELIREYYDAETQIQKLRNEVEDIEKTKLALFERRDSIETKSKKIADGQSYKEYQELKDKQKEKEEELKKYEDEISSIISKIDAGIKKYVKENPESILKKYLEHPVKTIIEDEKIEIIEEFDKLKNKIAELELKPDKEKRILKELNIVKKATIKEIRQKILELKEETQNLAKRVKNNIANLNVKEQKGWIQSIDRDIEEENKKIEEIENKLERINPNLIKQKIRKIIQELSHGTMLKKEETKNESNKQIF